MNIGNKINDDMFSTIMGTEGIAIISLVKDNKICKEFNNLEKLKIFAIFPSSWYNTIEVIICL